MAILGISKQSVREKNLKSNHNNQKKIAAINDLSGFGRCSMTVALPIISHMKVQCCPVITSVFSNHSGYKEYFFDDYTDKMEDYTDCWKKIGLEFDGIYTGFLGSERQIDIVCRFIDDFATDRTTVIVDPVMGDNGKAYATYTHEMCENMKKLVCKANLVTPNITEACILTGRNYDKSAFTEETLLEMAEQIASYGPQRIVITGIPLNESYLADFIYENISEKSNRQEVKFQLIKFPIVGTARCGTGDIFASILSADAVNNVDLETSVKKASGFIKKCIKRSVELGIPETDGVCFEEIIHELK